MTDISREPRIFMSDEGFWVDRTKPSVEGDDTFEECDPSDVVEALRDRVDELEAALNEKLPAAITMMQHALEVLNVQLEDAMQKRTHAD